MTTTDPSIVKLQSFVRGCQTRHKVGLMVDQMIQDMMMRQQDAEAHPVQEWESKKVDTETKEEDEKVDLEEWPASSPKSQLRPPKQPEEHLGKSQLAETTILKAANNETGTIKDRKKNFWRAASKKDTPTSMRKLQMPNQQESSPPNKLHSVSGASSVPSVVERYQPALTSKQEQQRSASGTEAVNIRKTDLAGMTREPYTKAVLNLSLAETEVCANTNSSSSTASSTLANAGMKREPSKKSVLNRYPATDTISTASRHAVNGSSIHRSATSTPRSTLAMARIKREPSTKSVLNRYPTATSSHDASCISDKKGSPCFAAQANPKSTLARAELNHEASSKSVTGRYLPETGDSMNQKDDSCHSEAPLGSVSSAPKREPASALAMAGMKREPSSKSVLSRYPAALSNHLERNAMPATKKESSTNHQPPSRPADFPRQQSRKAGHWHAFGNDKARIGSNSAKDTAPNYPSPGFSSVTAPNVPDETSSTPASNSFEHNAQTARNASNTINKRETPEFHREPPKKEASNRHQTAATSTSEIPRKRPSLESVPMGGSVSDRWNLASSNTYSHGSSSRNIPLPGKRRNKSGWNVFCGETKTGSSRKIVSCDDLAREKEAVYYQNVNDKSNSTVVLTSLVVQDGETNSCANLCDVERHDTQIDSVEQHGGSNEMAGSNSVSTDGGGNIDGDGNDKQAAIRLIVVETNASLEAPVNFTRGEEGALPPTDVVVNKNERSRNCIENDQNDTIHSEVGFVVKAGNVLGIAMEHDKGTQSSSAGDTGLGIMFEHVDDGAESLSASDNTILGGGAGHTDNASARRTILETHLSKNVTMNQANEEEIVPSKEAMATMAASLDVLDHADQMVALTMAPPSSHTNCMNGSIRFDAAPTGVHEFEPDSVVHTGRIPQWWIQAVPHDTLDERDIQAELGYYID